MHGIFFLYKCANVPVTMTLALAAAAAGLPESVHTGFGYYIVPLVCAPRKCSHSNALHDGGVFAAPLSDGTEIYELDPIYVRSVSFRMVLCHYVTVQ